MTPKEKRRLIDFIPDRWFTEKENSSVWLSAYHAVSVSKDDISSGANIIDLDDVLIIVGFFEGLRYLTMDEVAIISHPNGKYAFQSKLDEKTLPDGIYSILMTPFNVNGEEGNELVTRERLSIAISLMDIFIGRNIIFRHIFDTIVFGDGKKTTTISPVAEWPDWFPKPDLKQKNIDLIQRSSK